MNDCFLLTLITVILYLCFY